ncbi:MerR family transcriptional regulator [Sphaerisporangium melleum]|uniref:MerR family transcriptional regulator n=1 Tax=Sphaerisporangium melleum TaxID=321316 RepID=A0A917VL03_9ACTN|nr:MerR family transcriptional regulator [Sphaerisporangium melleum]GGK91340.1 MerR family transcriptional regulator [Sphaerisporangium melleum]GII72890.1 MerR family transcriptional regulator [Sphaerisporangium melleum]
MFSIGDFARLGRVSVRMLRHYDTLGLLRPAMVDQATGYRYYEAGQLSRLNRLIALKDLGLSLQQVGRILEEKVGPEEMHGMLRLRRAELETKVADDTARLARVEARLRMIEMEGVVPMDVVIKSVPGVRLAELSGIAESYDSIGPVVQPLYGELTKRLGMAGLAIVGPAVAYYEQVPEGVRVHAGAPAHLEPGKTYDFDVVDLPAVEQAATIVHHGAMEDIGATWQRLAQWIEANGFRSSGVAREVYLVYGDGDPAGWVTELQEPVTR